MQIIFMLLELRISISLAILSEVLIQIGYFLSASL